MASQTTDGFAGLATDSEPLFAKHSPDRGVLLVISGPSGVGKSTVVQRLRDRLSFYFSVSVTTRDPRPGEVDGVDYNFVDRARFDELSASGALLEWAEYSNRCYGTPREGVIAKLDSGTNVLLDIENRGALQVKASYPDSLILFLAPPSMKVLEDRLTNRGDTSPKQVKARLAVAQLQLEEARETYDALIINDDVDRAVDEIVRILAAHERGIHVD